MYIIIKVSQVLEIPDSEIENCTATGVSERVNQRVAEWLSTNGESVWIIAKETPSDLSIAA